MGGTIGPGLQVSLDALVSRTAMLPRVELQMPQTVLGRNTVEQIQAGVVAGYVGNMEYLIRQVMEEMNCDGIKVIATGGLSRMIAQQTDRINIVDTMLTLDALLLHLQKNRQILIERMHRIIPGAVFSPLEGTYLQWIDLSCMGLPQDKLMEKLEQAQIYVNDGATFGTGGEGHIRFNLACPTSAIEAAMDRLEALLG